MASNNDECCQGKNPLFTNQWFKYEKHNACRAQSLYGRIISQMINQRGYTLFYYPVSEYRLDEFAALWGEDPQKKYFEKYTMKAFTDGENDPLTFNSHGVTMEEGDRVIHISKKTFTDVTGKPEPQYGDHYLWTQNGIIYQVENFNDIQNIVLGNEAWWTIYSVKRLTEGEIYGDDNCNSMREDVIDPFPGEPEACDLPVGDGNITDGDDVHIPEPQPEANDDDEVLKRIEDKFLRNSWGGW